MLIGSAVGRAIIIGKIRCLEMLWIFIIKRNFSLERGIVSDILISFKILSVYSVLCECK